MRLNPNTRRRLERLEEVSHAAAVPSVVIIDGQGVIVHGCGAIGPWLGRSKNDLPSDAPVAIVGGIDLDVVVGRKPGLDRQQGDRQGYTDCVHPSGGATPAGGDHGLT